MSRQKIVTIDETTYTLQSISATTYTEINDKFGIPRSSKAPTNRSGYHNWLIKNCVVEPKEVQSQGASYFDSNDDDISGLYELIGEIESFLGERIKRGASKKQG
jgi:hypothetical protein